MVPNELASALGVKDIESLDPDGPEMTGFLLVGYLTAGWIKHLECCPAVSMKTGEFLAVLSRLGADVEVEFAWRCCETFKDSIKMPEKVDGEYRWRIQHVRCVQTCLEVIANGKP